jgi:hypothetical protein
VLHPTRCDTPTVEIIDEFYGDYGSHPERTNSTTMKRNGVPAEKSTGRIDIRRGDIVVRVSVPDRSDATGIAKLKAPHVSNLAKNEAGISKPLQEGMFPLGYLRLADRREFAQADCCFHTGEHG